jgi:phosphatidylglycerophosphatase A
MKFIATLGPLGYSPIAPGTVGTALACIVYVIFRPDTVSLLLVIPLLFVLGIVASTRTEQLLNEKDSSRIVIDEVVGYFVSILWIPYSTKFIILSFVIFRIFDIIKPPPIRFVEIKVRGGLGVMLDDILAGIYTNLVLRLFVLLE